MSEITTPLAFEFYDEVMNKLDALVVVLDAEGTVLLFNQACQALSGYASTGILGKPIWETLLHESDAGLLKRAFTWLTVDWFPNDSDYTWVSSKNKQYLIHTRQRVILNEAGDLQYIVWTGTDVTATRRVETTIRERLTHYQRIVETMRAPLAVQNEHGLIMFANERFCELAGYSHNEVISLPFRKLIAEDNLEKLAYHRERHKQGESDIYELDIKQSGGTTRTVLATQTPVFDDKQIYRGCFGIYTDINSYKQSEQALSESSAELNAFAQTVARDLKEPIAVLNSLVNSVAQNHKTMPDSEMVDTLQTISHNGEQMIGIIDELLLISRLRDTDRVPFQPLDMDDVVQNAYQRIHYIIEQYGAKVTIPEAHTWPEVFGYADWVEEIWVNYISNAIKYGGQPPQVELGFTRQIDGMVRFWVRDNGRGILPDKQKTIFTPFTRLQDVRALGHGLGLSVVQRIVDKLGGEVGLESTPGQGSVFSFTLPLRSTVEHGE